MIERRQAGGIGGIAPGLCSGGRDQRRDAVDMVPVVVGDQDVGQAPAARCQFGLDGLGVGHVDHGGGPGLGIMQKEGIVVGKARDSDDLQGHGIFLLPG